MAFETLDLAIADGIATLTLSRPERLNAFTWTMMRELIAAFDQTDADDAVRAVEHGAQAIVVSNHGGRQLDTAIPAIMALPEVVESVAGRAEVYVDGGIRRGTDVLKAIALGARAVMVGRPVLWGLAVNGEAGVGAVLELLRKEVDLAMALAGARNVYEITRDLVTTL